VQFLLEEFRFSVKSSLSTQTVRHRLRPGVGVVGPDFQKILRQTYDSVKIFVQNETILRQTYNNVIFEKS